MQRMPGCSCDRGATLLETAIVLPVFLMITFLAVDFLLLTYCALTTQFIATRVMREAIVGPARFNISPYDTAASPYSAYISGEIARNAQNFAVSISPADVQIACIPDTACAGDPGQPGALVQVRVEVIGHLAIFGNLNAASGVVARNELWSP